MKTKCKCKSPYQDKEYGKNIRIANSTGKLNIVRCTVCGKELTTVKETKK